MRISDWSSDVCSSDLLDNVCLAGKSAALYGAGGAARAVLFALQTMGIAHVTILNRTQERARTLLTEFGLAGAALPLLAPLPALELVVNSTRSEERRVGKGCVSRCRSRRSP